MSLKEKSGKKFWTLDKIIRHISSQEKVSDRKTREELADFVGVTHNTMYRWCNFSKEELRKTVKYDTVERIIVFAKKHSIDIEPNDIISSIDDNLKENEINMDFSAERFGLTPPRDKKSK